MRIHLKTQYIDEEGDVGRAQYADGSLALLFAPATGEPAWALSLNLSAYGMVPPEDHVYIGGYSQHLGVCSGLVNAGVVELVDQFIFGPYDTPGYLVKVLT